MTREGFFVQPTVIEAIDPRCRTMCDELFGPVLTRTCTTTRATRRCSTWRPTTSPYALTGAIFATDRAAIRQAAGDALRFAAGNFYVNDKPTGAGRRPATLRRRARVGHERQGRLGPEPPALGLAAHDQGNARPAAGLTLSVHGARRLRFNQILTGRSHGPLTGAVPRVTVMRLLAVAAGWLTILVLVLPVKGF